LLKYLTGLKALTGAKKLLDIFPFSSTQALSLSLSQREREFFQQALRI
jgi:hypothetical protein